MNQIKPINFSIIVSILQLISGYQQLLTTLCRIRISTVNYSVQNTYINCSLICAEYVHHMFTTRCRIRTSPVHYSVQNTYNTFRHKPHSLLRPRHFNSSFLYKFIFTVELSVASFIKYSYLYHFKRESHTWFIHCKLNLITDNKNISLIYAPEITHTSRFAYATASGMTEYNACKKKPRHSTSRRKEIISVDMLQTISQPSNILSNHYLVIILALQSVSCSGESKLLSEHELPIPNRRAIECAAVKTKWSFMYFLYLSTGTYAIVPTRFILMFCGPCILV